MEISLRCAIPDRPGSLAALAGAIADAGGDIEAVEVVDSVEGWAYDDLIVVVRDPAHLRDLLERLTDLPEIDVVHAAPSRGHPGDAATRFAIVVEAMLSGAMTVERAATALIGGMLRARDAGFMPASEAPPEEPTVIVVPIGDRRLVLRRDYRFTATERGRALALARLCETAGSSAGPHSSSSTPAGVG